MGGIWGIIAAQSAEAITRRYLQLRVITIGDPGWVTPAKYAEIVNEWIKPHERFDIEHPTGWLARWDDRLSGRENQAADVLTISSGDAGDLPQERPQTNVD